MSCHVCSRGPTSRIRHYCPTCARNYLYHLRAQHASVLLEKDMIGKHIEHATASRRMEERPGMNDIDLNIITTQTITNETARSSSRISLLVEHIDSLRLDVESRRLDISKRRLALTQRRSDAESATYQVSDRDNAALSNLENNTRRTDHLWHSLHSKTAEDRIFLCREAANLYGLRQNLRKKNGEFKETYAIGGIPIIDLRDLNGANPAQISTSLAHIARLLVLISHYLSLRLPAEVTLPHRNYPTPTIYTPSGSYIIREYTAMPPPSHLTSSSPGASRAAELRAHHPRPRPISIDRSLPKLAREDPAAYALFLEGAALLAWNVSWLCRTQGLSVASDSWEEICDIGKNLWQLLVAPPAQSSTLMRAFAGRDIQTKMKLAKDSPKTTIQRTKSFPMLGHYSHGTAHSFLGASEGTDFVRTWKLPAPTRIVDQLKSCLLGEMASAEWELLEKKEWDDISHDTVELPAHEGHDISTIEPTSLSSATQNDRGGPRVEGEANSHLMNLTRLKGTSGWTKLRNR